VIHLCAILGIRNKMVVLLDWIWNYVIYNQSLRLIFFTGKSHSNEVLAL